MKSSSKTVLLKNSAKTMMEGKYYAAIMAFLFFNLTNLLLNNFSATLALQISSTLQRLLSLSEEAVCLTIVSYFVIFLFTTLCNIFRIGICLFFLNIACNQYFSTFDLFYGFQNFWKSYGLSLIMTLLGTLCLAPLDAFLYLRKHAGGLSTDVLILLLGIQLLLLLLYTPISLALSQSYYVMLDYPDLSIPSILKQSVKIMQGKKWQLFKIQLSFLPLFLLILPTFGLGALWLTPYVNMTYALFYLDNMKAEA